jgi:hypothetical protein
MFPLLIEEQPHAAYEILKMSAQPFLVAAEIHGLSG